MNWQQIETAPTDGSDVMLFGPNGVCFAGYEKNIFSAIGYWYDSYGNMVISPTHWQPMPDPPSSASPELLAALAADESNRINPLAHEQTR